MCLTPLHEFFLCVLSGWALCVLSWLGIQTQTLPLTFSYAKAAALGPCLMGSQVYKANYFKSDVTAYKGLSSEKSFCNISLLCNLILCPHAQYGHCRSTYTVEPTCGEYCSLLISTRIGSGDRFTQKGAKTFFYEAAAVRKLLLIWEQGKRDELCPTLTVVRQAKRCDWGEFKSSKQQLEEISGKLRSSRCSCDLRRLLVWESLWIKMPRAKMFIFFQTAPLARRVQPHRVIMCLSPAELHYKEH